MDLVDPPHSIPVTCAYTNLFVILHSLPLSLFVIELEQLLPQFIGLIIFVESFILFHLLMFLIDLRQVFIELFILLFTLLIKVDLVLINFGLPITQGVPNLTPLHDVGFLELIVQVVLVGVAGNCKTNIVVLV